MRRVLVAAVLAALCATAAPAPAQAAAPKVRQLVVFRDGSALAKTASTRAARVRVEGRSCTAGPATALAALARSRPGRLRLRDFGACSSRPSDGGGLFVRAIRGDANRGRNGWVYKVGRRAATAGAADPSGPFGTGRRLRSGQRVTWFYCRLRDGGCQRTLELELRAEARALTAVVRGYDDEGRGAAVENATVRAGAVSATTAADGLARLSLAAGEHLVWAEKDGLIRSFAERVAVP